MASSMVFWIVDVALMVTVFLTVVMAVLMGVGELGGIGVDHVLHQIDRRAVADEWQRV
jgi:hypothetical protein